MRQPTPYQGGFLDVHDEFFTGDGLARCASDAVPTLAESIRYLRRDAALRSGGFVRVCGGPGDAEAHEDDFERPTRLMRAQIWRNLIPEKLPLAADIDFERLALPDMTGGEIKNAVFNAARIALVRAPGESVAMADFEQAIAMEISGRWAKQAGGSIGFCR
jgi:hypothetical protein